MCGIAVSEEKFNAKLKKMQGLRRPCGELKTVTSPYGLHKNRKAALWFGRLILRTVAANTPQAIYIHVTMQEDYGILCI